jgi:peptidase C25-like protein
MGGCAVTRCSRVAAVAAAALLAPAGAWGQAAIADRCPSGLVWREAFEGDHLCVTPDLRATARQDNPAAGPAQPVAPGPDPFAGVTGPRPLLVIAPDEFMAALAPLVAHKNATGMPAVALSIAQLTAYFPGLDHPEKIKRAIAHAQARYATRYVMLVGDAHWFPVRFMFFKGFSRAYPGHPDEGTLPVDGVYAPSDLYYANLYHHRVVRSPRVEALAGPFDDWDADRNGLYNETDWSLSRRARNDWNAPNPDRVDGYPDVAVGRVTAHSAADVTTYVNKVIRYETQRPQKLLFTFVADGIYPDAPELVDPILAHAGLNRPAAFLIINKPDPKAARRWVANATPAMVADKINSSVWVGYLGHGSQQSWDGRAFGRGLVKLTAHNEALPVVFTDGCVTGRFAIEAPFDYDYVDVAGVRHKFAFAPGADPRNPSIPAVIDSATGERWGGHCAGCRPLPLVTPKPDPYDIDRGAFNFAYPWLFGFPDGGAIAYFGEIGIMEPQMAAELETYMLASYVRGERNLGAIYLGAERQYWAHHIDDRGIVDHHSPSRLYLGFEVMFGDPSLRLH